MAQEWPGHSDIALELNTYSHVLPVMQEEVADKLDELLIPIEMSNELMTKVEASQRAKGEHETSI